MCVLTIIPCFTIIGIVGIKINKKLMMKLQVKISFINNKNTVK